MFPGIKPDRNESLPEWITKAYNKRNPTYDSITQDLGAKPVTNIAEVDVDGFYLAKMPWYARDYRKVISEMIETAKKDPAIIAEIKQNEVESERQTNEIVNKYNRPYNECLYEIDVDEVEKLQAQIQSNSPNTNKLFRTWQDKLAALYEKYDENKSKCQHIMNNMKAEKDKMKQNAPRGLTKVEDLYKHLKDLQDIPLLFIKVLGIQDDDMIHCHGYDVKTGKIYAHLVEEKFGSRSDIDVFSIHFRDVELFSIPGRGEALLGGKRRSKTNGRFRKYRSRRNISSRTQRRKKTQRRQR